MDDRETSADSLALYRSFWFITALLAVAAVFLLQLDQADREWKKFGPTQGQILLALVVMTSFLVMILTGARRFRSSNVAKTLHRFFTMFTGTAATFAIALSVYRDAIMFPEEWSAVVRSRNLDELLRSLSDWPFPWTALNFAFVVTAMVAIVVIVRRNALGASKWRE